MNLTKDDLQKLVERLLNKQDPALASPTDADGGGVLSPAPPSTTISASPDTRPSEDTIAPMEISGNRPGSIPESTPPVFIDGLSGRTGDASGNPSRYEGANVEFDPNRRFMPDLATAPPDAASSAILRQQQPGVSTTIDPSRPNAGAQPNLLAAEPPNYRNALEKAQGEYDSAYNKRIDERGRFRDRDKGKGSAIVNFLKGLGIGAANGAQGGLIGMLTSGLITGVGNTAKGNIDEQWAWEQKHQPRLQANLAREQQNAKFQSDRQVANEKLLASQSDRQSEAINRMSKAQETQTSAFYNHPTVKLIVTNTKRITPQVAEQLNGLWRRLTGTEAGLTPESWVHFVEGMRNGQGTIRSEFSPSAMPDNLPPEKTKVPVGVDLGDGVVTNVLPQTAGDMLIGRQEKNADYNFKQQTFDYNKEKDAQDRADKAEERQLRREEIATAKGEKEAEKYSRATADLDAAEEEVKNLQMALDSDPEDATARRMLATAKAKVVRARRLIRAMEDASDKREGKPPRQKLTRQTKTTVQAPFQDPLKLF